MASNAFSPSKLDIVNQVLGELGRLPVNNIENDQTAMLIALRLDVLMPELLRRTQWNWAVKFITDGNPITENFSVEFNYSFQLPFDFGRLFKFYQLWSLYEIADGLLLTNQTPVQYYYIVNSVPYDVLETLFQQVLVLYTASRVCLSTTNNIQLTEYLEKVYRDKLADAMLLNDMERLVIETPFNDYDRVTYV